MLLKEYPLMDSTQSIADYAETVAEAQLKKAMEWLNSDCPHEQMEDFAGEKMATQTRRECDECWQAQVDKNTE